MENEILSDRAVTVCANKMMLHNLKDIGVKTLPDLCDYHMEVVNRTMNRSSIVEVEEILVLEISKSHSMSFVKSPRWRKR